MTKELMKRSAVFLPVDMAAKVDEVSASVGLKGGEAIRYLVARGIEAVQNEKAAK